MGGGGGGRNWADISEGQEAEDKQEWRESHKRTIRQWRTNQPAQAAGVETPQTQEDLMATLHKMMATMAQEQNEFRLKMEQQESKE